MDQVKIGVFLKELRKQKNLTQQEAADALYVSQKTISRWETGEGIPDISIIVEVAKFYDVTVDDILNGEKKERIKVQVIEKEVNNDIIEKNIIKKLNTYFFISTGIVIFTMIICLIIAFTINPNPFIIVMPIILVVCSCLYLFGYNEYKNDIKDSFKVLVINKNIYFADVIFITFVLYIFYIIFCESIGCL